MAFAILPARDFYGLVYGKKLVFVSGDELGQSQPNRVADASAREPVDRMPHNPFGQGVFQKFGLLDNAALLLQPTDLLRR
jgi:hypothetical protein